MFIRGSKQESITTQRHIGAMRRCALLLIVIAAMLPLVWSCKEEDKLRTFNVSSKKRPTMTTHNVMTIVSDSGVPQYRIVSPTWYIYDDVDTPMWILPGGPYLEKFDEDFNIMFTVAADSAVNNRVTSEWILMGNVEYFQEPDILILTPMLIWNQRENTVSSDSFIHVEQPGKIIEGYGFVGKISNGGLSEYRLKKPMGVLPYQKPGSLGQRGPMPVSPLSPPTSNVTITPPSVSPISPEEPATPTPAASPAQAPKSSEPEVEKEALE